MRTHALATILFLFTAIPSTVAFAQFGLSPGDLAKAHQQLKGLRNCTKCHVVGKGVPDNKCLECHTDIAERRKNKKGFHNSKTVREKEFCWKCHHDHVGKSFDMINGSRDNKGPAWPQGSKKKFNHNDTGYKLLGGHKGLDCNECHNPKKKRPNSSTRTFLGNDQKCIACHENYHEFKAGDALNKCQKCHNFESWTKFNIPLDFDHNKTSFPLNGAHEKIQCQNCHPEGKPFAPLAHDKCETCHTSDSPHRKIFTSKACTYCHTEIRWKGKVKVKTSQHKQKLSKKGHDPKGAHRNLKCSQCHIKVKMTPKNDTCTTCHNNIHGKRWMKEIKGCEKCHGQKRWESLLVETSDHKDFTKWELKGHHLEQKCIKCHRGAPDEIPESTECASCHTDVHDGGRGKDCARCHSEQGWGAEEVIFDHDRDTRFPLTGMHTSLQCEQCHPDPETFKQRDSSCKACHAAPHLDKLPDTCEDCHNTTDWEDEKFDHNTQARFRLSGKHAKVNCFKCHLDLGFKETPLSCMTCHWDYHDGTWGVTECKQCHSPSTWRFDRRRVIFENLHNFGDVVLTGAHTKVPCESCHNPSPRFLLDGFGAQCTSCHQDAHFGALGPECQDCHGQQAWIPSNFRHASTGFPLTGVHRIVPCRECHKNNVFAGTPDECLFCHADDANKSHGLNQNAIYCSECHYTTRWTPSRPGSPLPTGGGLLR